jgi:hypothetical protein
MFLRLACVALILESSLRAAEPLAMKWNIALIGTETDPHEVKNLADSSIHQEKWKELTSALDKWMADT